MVHQTERPGGAAQATVSLVRCVVDGRGRCIDGRGAERGRMGGWSRWEGEVCVVVVVVGGRTRSQGHKEK